MNRFDGYIKQYERIIHAQKRVFLLQTKLHLRTLGIFTAFVLITLGIGLLSGLWQNLPYLVVMSTITVVITLVLHKMMYETEVRKRQDITYHLWDVVGIEVVYIISIVMTTVLALLLTAYSHAMSLFLIIMIAIILVGSSVVYYLFRSRMEHADIPTLKRIWFNGLIIAALFYSVTMLVRISNVPISIFVTIMIIYTLVETRMWLEKRFVFHINRYAVVFLGAFLILLSFPFNQGFNVISLYRGEFSLRMVYEKFVDPTHVFDSSIEGDILFYEDKLVIANEDSIQFYNEDFTLDKTIDHDFDYVYEMNGRLLANKENSTSILYNDVYEWDGTEFTFLNEFYMQSTERPVFYDGNSYASSSGYVYQRLEGSEDYIVLPIEDNDELTNVEETEDYLLFNRQYPFFVHNNSFQDRVRGVNYDHLAYDNNHMIIMYSRMFVVQNSEYADPRDDRELVLYLTSTERYFSGEVYVPSAMVMPHLFVVDRYQYESDYHFLLGHVLYSSGEFKYSMLMLDDEATIINDIMLDDLNVAISDEYIALQDGSIKVFDIDSETGLHYRFVDGYGVTFTVAMLVTLFAVEQAQIHPIRKNIDEFEKKPKE